ncbi:MAG TPA: hypothetical protein VD993_15495 [Chitinophagaceae bacterium]|nr:hypothetical protein [Chitinophagaceae bacterium]
MKASIRTIMSIAVAVLIGLSLALALYFFGRNLSYDTKRRMASALLVLYPLLTCVIIFFNQRKLFQSAHVDYRAGILSLYSGTPYLFPMITLYVWLMVAGLDFGVGLVFAISIFAAWIFVSFYSSRWQFNGMVTGRMALRVLLYLAPVIFFIYFLQLNSRSERNFFDSISETFHSRVISLLGDPQDAAVKASIGVIDSDSLTINQIERAEQNRWFIENFKSVHPPYLGVKSQLHEHFQQGSNLETQFSDTLPVRYLYSEHGWLFMLLPFLLLLGLSLFPAVHVSGGYNDNSGTIAGNALSLFFLLYMAFFALTDLLINLNFFPFAGINYLMFSINDIGFTIVFLVTIVCSLWLMRQRGRKTTTVFYVTRFLTYLGLLVLMVIVFAVISFRVTRGVSNFDFDQVVASVQDKVRVVNEELRDFVHEIPQQAARDRVLGMDANRFLGEFKNNWRSVAISDTSRDYASQLVMDFIKHNKDKRNPVQFLFVERSDSVWQIGVNESFFRKFGLYNNKQGALPEIVGAIGDTLGNKGIYSGGVFQPLRNFYRNTQLLEGTHTQLLALPAAAFRRTSTTHHAYEYFAAVTDTSFYLVAGNENNARKNNSTLRPFAVSVPLDSINVFELNNAGGRAIPLKCNWRKEQVVARPVWVNGRFKYLYPENNGSLYEYVLSENIKKMEGNTVMLSFDMALQSRLDSILAAHYSPRPDSASVQASVTCVDGNFKLRAMSQNDVVSRNLRLNPNLLSSITDLNLLFYHLTKNQKDSLLLKRSLEGTDVPASTIKPFTYSAVVGGLRASWQTLELAEENRQFMRLREGDYLSNFAGRGVGKYIAEDEGRLTPTEFLARSINLYHGLIAYIGSYTKEQVQQSLLNNPGADNSIVRRVNRVTDSIEHFPYFRYNNILYRFNPARWPRESNASGNLFGNTASLLSDGFAKNYKTLLRWPEGDSSRLANWYRENFADSFLLTNVIFRDYLLPQRSWYGENLRLVRTARGENPNYYFAIRGTFSGASVFSFSPAMLAVMATRLFTLDNTGRLSFFEHSDHTRTPSWIRDEAYNDVNLLNMFRQTIYNGMHLSNTTGTARELLHSAFMQIPYNADNAIEWGGRQFYLYTKTGTGDETSRDESNIKRKNLLLVFSDRNLHDQLGFREFSQSKIYSVYIQLKFHEGHEWNDTDKRMIARVVEAILQSATFRKYYGL